jgi:hypothetical protein
LPHLNHNYSESACPDLQGELHEPCLFHTIQAF